MIFDQIAIESVLHTFHETVDTTHKHYALIDDVLCFWSLFQFGETMWNIRVINGFVTSALFVGYHVTFHVIIF